MASRYEVRWKDASGKERSARWAFRPGAAAYFALLCDLEYEGAGVTSAVIEYLGPNGERDERKVLTCAAVRESVGIERSAQGTH
jgi:hypothetical protein